MLSSGDNKSKRVDRIDVKKMTCAKAGYNGEKITIKTVLGASFNSICRSW